MPVLRRREPHPAPLIRERQFRHRHALAAFAVLPGRSNAFAIAARLGLDETIIAEARKMISTADIEAEKLLDEIHRQRDVVRRERALALDAREEAERLERRLNERLEKIEAERRKVIEVARAEAAKEVEVLREELSELKRKLARAALPLEALKQVETRVEELEEQTDRPITNLEDAGTTVSGRAHTRRPLRLGDTVLVKTIRTSGVITALTATSAEVQIGRLRLRAKPDELVHPDVGATVTFRSPGATVGGEGGGSETELRRGKDSRAGRGEAVSPGMELDLRGRMVEEGLEELERYLDAAFLASLPWVRIIHGKGTGKLRAAVRQALKSKPIVSGVEAGQDGEGGEGVTVAKLAHAD